MIELFSHNLAAYKSAAEMLAETGKAAVIHPTGTGKSFIAFKLCEDHPNRRVLWLGPSEYIFKTQVENLEAVCDTVPENIVFCTYAKLAYMTDEEVREIEPDYIVLDEFHRCGAEVWGKGVQALLSRYPSAPVLGLSATNIRYLDNRRDMADELFDGNVASEMTLGEAIVRGILNPPTYITAIYSCMEDLKKYERRIASRKSKTVRDRAEIYLEKLRRALEQAEGLDTIFDKHIQNRTGKYLIFCSDYESLRELLSGAQNMFGKVNRAIHAYSVYSSSPESDKAFEAFKADKTDALRLLYCIDMLNEGIHVEDVDGVILFRPTISPIVYKQQIGRALSASKNKNPVIFDIVNNFENLYLVGALEKEMLQAAETYRSTGENQFIVHERFRVIDEVRRCREIFDRIESILAVPWDTMYREAKEYYQAHGDLLPPSSYETPEGYGLGQWVVTQRTNRRTGSSALTQERIAKLDRIGMVWATAHERFWEENFAQAAAYFESYGNLDIPKGYSSKLNKWLVKQRQRLKRGQIPKDHYERLSAIGMIWDTDAFEKGFAYAEAYYRLNGNLDIPSCFVAEDGYGLGAWYRSIRTKYKENGLTDEQFTRLKSIGFEERSVLSRTWEAYYNQAKAYYQSRGNLNINARYETDDGKKLGVWISGQRCAYGKRKLTQNQIELLEQIGMSWHRDKSRFCEGLSCAESYFLRNKTLNPAIGYVCDNGFPLGRWIATQRHKYKNGRLSAKNIAALERLGIVWDIAQAFWDQGREHALAYYKAYGNSNVPAEYVCSDGFKLGDWIRNQRTKYRKNALSAEQVAKLDAVEMVWFPNERNWRTAYEYAKKYYLENGHLRVPQQYKTADGFRLGFWICSQRKAYRARKLGEDKVKMLFAIGFDADKPGLTVTTVAV